MSSEEPKTIIKCSLRSFCKKQELFHRIQNAIVQVDKITKQAYLLLNLHIRRLIEEKQPLPCLENNFLRQFFYCVSHLSKKSGKAPKIDEELTRTKELLYSKYDINLFRDGLKHCLNSEAIAMETAIKNNITLHFFKRQRRYLKLFNQELSNAELNEKLDAINAQIGEDLHQVSLPSSISAKGIAYDLVAEPEKFLIPMYHMNLIQEVKDQKTFSILPLRRGFVAKSIRIDHTTLSSWMNYKPPNKDDEKKKRSRKDKDIPARDALWNEHFDLTRIKINNHKYHFDHSIVTDGVSVSCQFALKDKSLIKKVTKKSKKAVKEEEKDHQKDLLATLKDRIVVGIDPGKHSILYCTTDEDTIDKRLQYTNIQRRVELGRKHYQRLQRRFKKKEIQDAESLLSLQNSRCSTVASFIKYVDALYKVQDKLEGHYGNIIYRLHTWYSFKKKKRSESNLVKSIRKKFGKDAVLAYGTWNRISQMPGLIPSPTSGIRNLLSKHFTVVDTPEYRTTKLCSKCHIGEMKPVLTRNKTKKDASIIKVDVRGLRRCNNEAIIGISYGLEVHGPRSIFRVEKVTEMDMEHDFINNGPTSYKSPDWWGMEPIRKELSQVFCFYEEPFILYNLPYGGYYHQRSMWDESEKPPRSLIISSSLRQQQNDINQQHPSGIKTKKKKPIEEKKTPYRHRLTLKTMAYIYLAITMCTKNCNSSLGIKKYDPIAVQINSEARSFWKDDFQGKSGKWIGLHKDGRYAVICDNYPNKCTHNQTRTVELCTLPKSGIQVWLDHSHTMMHSLHIQPFNDHELLSYSWICIRHSEHHISDDEDDEIQTPINKEPAVFYSSSQRQQINTTNTDSKIPLPAYGLIVRDYRKIYEDCGIYDKGRPISIIQSLRKSDYFDFTERGSHIILYQTKNSVFSTMELVINKCFSVLDEVLDENGKSRDPNALLSWKGQWYRRLDSTNESSPTQQHTTPMQSSFGSMQENLLLSTSKPDYKRFIFGELLEKLHSLGFRKEHGLENLIFSEKPPTRYCEFTANVEEWYRKVYSVDTLHLYHTLHNWFLFEGMHSDFKVS